jgi:type II secretory pathway pseudopilin PulG
MIELLVVIMVIAIASAVVVPYLASAESFEAQAAARTVFSDLLFAQNDAVAEQAARRVIFDTTNHSYRIADGSGNTLTASWLGGIYEVDLGPGSDWPGVTLASVTFASNTLEFDDLGTPSEGGTIRLEAGSFDYEITVTPLTGKITVDQVSGGSS